jgi:hypothetical protein
MRKFLTAGSGSGNVAARFSGKCFTAPGKIASRSTAPTDSGLAAQGLRPDCVLNTAGENGQPAEMRSK